MNREFVFKENKEEEYGTRILEKIRFGLRKAIGGSVISSLEFNKFHDDIIDSIIYEIRGFVLGKNEIATIEYYATWWQEIRTRVLSKRWLKRHPSNKKKVVFKAAYPSINIALEKHAPYITFHTRDIKEGVINE